MQMICWGSKLWQKSTCSVMTFHKHIHSIHGKSAEPSLAEIHQEMSELLEDKQVYAQTEKNF